MKGKIPCPHSECAYGPRGWMLEVGQDCTISNEGAVLGSHLMSASNAASAPLLLQFSSAGANCKSALLPALLFCESTDPGCRPFGVEIAGGEVPLKPAPVWLHLGEKSTGKGSNPSSQARSWSGDGGSTKPPPSACGNAQAAAALRSAVGLSLPIIFTSGIETFLVCNSTKPSSAIRTPARSELPCAVPMPQDHRVYNEILQ